MTKAMHLAQPGRVALAVVGIPLLDERFICRDERSGTDEPMAWAYDVGQARVFQTLLGHSAESIRKAAPLIRRGSLWSAKRAPLSFDPPKERLEKATFRQGARWVMHAGLQDVELLLRDFAQAQPPELFDTQIAWGMSGPEASVSLAFLLFKLLGIRSPKGYQADDWMYRPLPEAQLAYAAADIAHLPALESVLGGRMRDQVIGIVERGVRLGAGSGSDPGIAFPRQEPLGLGNFAVLDF